MEAAHTRKERKYQEQIVQNSRNNEELLLLQIQKTWNELDEAYQQMAVATESIRQTEENLKINRDNYKAGMVNISEMLEAQALMQESERILTDMQTQYRIKMVEYMQVTGRYGNAQ